MLALSQSLKDTKHFIQIYKGLSISDDSVLFTLDVNALYISIPHENIRTVISTVLDSCNFLDPPTFFLMELLDLILDKNFFRFGDQFYFQIKGVAMGSAVTPSIANLFMGHLENLYILNPTNNPFFNSVTHYYRNNDDLIFIYNNPETVNDFVKWLNEIHESIRFST